MVGQAGAHSAFGGGCMGGVVGCMGLVGEFYIQKRNENKTHTKKSEGTLNLHVFIYLE